MALSTLTFALRFIYAFQLYPIFSLLRIWTTPNMIEHWSLHCIWICKINLIKLPGQPLTNKFGTILLVNQRNMTDYFVHEVMAEGKTSFLSRALMGIAFPALGFICFVWSYVWFFKRGATGTKIEEFNNWLDYKFSVQKQDRPLLTVYPEGHRNSGKGLLPLRTGMLKYAFSRKCDV